MRKRILIIDDDEDTVFALSSLLHVKGYDAVTAGDGAEALLIADRERPNVVLLDIGMPGMGGLEVCRRLREEPWGKDLLIVAITGWGRTTDEFAAIAAGCDLHLAKPVRFETLQEVLEREGAVGSASSL